MTETTQPKRRRKMTRRAAAAAAGAMSLSAVAGAAVLVQNFMTAEFTAAAAPCLEKVAGADVSFDGFEFDGTTTALVDNVNVTSESITLNGVTGDRVVANDVYRIENNCDVDLQVNIVDGVQAGVWTEKHLEVWLGASSIPVGSPLPATYGLPNNTDADWDDDILEFNPPGITSSTTNGADSAFILVPAGEYVPVGMVMTTGAASVGTGDASWTVEAYQP